MTLWLNELPWLNDLININKMTHKNRVPLYEVFRRPKRRRRHRTAARCRDYVSREKAARNMQNQVFMQQQQKCLSAINTQKEAKKYIEIPQFSEK